MADYPSHIIDAALENLTPGEIEELILKIRNDVNRLDAELIEILIKRINLSNEIGRIKKTGGLKTYDAPREREIDNNIDKLCENPDIKKSLKRIYERILDESRALQRERKK